MKAVVFEGTRSVAVRDVPDATIEHSKDVIVRITSSALCGSDLHMYDGRSAARPGLILGHEPLGVVETIGSDVGRVHVGDRVVMPTHIFCGECVNCARGFTAACLNVNPGGYGGAYGYAGMGPYAGAQAELLRVPYADVNCVELPGRPGDGREDDFVLLADAFVTGWHGTELCGVGMADSVAVFGAGCIGLLAAYSALFRGASEVYVVDRISERLAKAKELGAIPVDFTDGDPVEQIRALRRSRSGGLPPGEERMGGVGCVIDAVGFQSRDRQDPGQENSTQVLRDAIRLVNPTGRMAVLGVYSESDPAPVDPEGAGGSERVPWATLFGKGIAVGFGRTHDRRYTTGLRDLVLSGRARPSAVVTHHPTLEEAPQVYRAFDQRADGIIKAVFRTS